MVSATRGKKSRFLSTSGTTGPPVGWIRDPRADSTRESTLEQLRRLATPGMALEKKSVLDSLVRFPGFARQPAQETGRSSLQKGKNFSVSSTTLADELSAWKPGVLIGAPRLLLAAALALHQANRALSLACLPGCTCFHADHTFVHIEILKRQGEPCAPKEYGAVVLTDLTNFNAPLIRYNTGDLAQVPSPHDCSCALSSPALHLAGRAHETVLFPDGTTLHTGPLIQNLSETTGCVPTLHQTHPQTIQLRLLPLQDTNTIH